MPELFSQSFFTMAYLAASICFILALDGLSSPGSARRGSSLGIAGMIIAVGATLLNPSILSYEWIIAGVLVGGSIGTVIALRIKMTDLPQLVAAFHSLVGLAAVFVAASALYNPSAFGIGNVGLIQSSSLVEMSLGTIIGAITFTSSVIAFSKLQGIMKGSPIVFPAQHFVNLMIFVGVLVAAGFFVAGEAYTAFWIMTSLALLLGVTGILPIGGADMPVVISMLNSFSGWAACGIGFTLSNHLLIVTGALVGSSGAILSYVMCKGMNRSLWNVAKGGFGAEGGVPDKAKEHRPVHAGSAEDAAFIMQNVSSVIIIPGYGMAVAQAQHALRELADLLKGNGVRISYAIHPVAGRMPGHMNVLLAEASVPYEEVMELDEINRDFAATDVAFVIGANDVTNPLAKTDPTSSIYGMPVLDVEKSGKVLFVKRSMGVGYAGVDNELFYRDNTMMLFGDAKKMVENIIKHMA